MSTEPFDSRIVTPRKASEHRALPIIAVSDAGAFVESTGELVDFHELAVLLRTHPPAMVVVQNASRLLLQLDYVMSHTPLWQYRVTPDKREVFSPKRPDIARRITKGCVVNFFGWQSPVAKKRGHYHYPLDPAVFARLGIHELIPGDAPEVVKLFQWGQDVRAWLVANKLRLSPTNGGIAGQLLRDPRWFPEARRKVPKATNARARATLPGNHYRLYVPEGRAFKASYLDMQSSHHNMARRITFPDPNSLIMRGRFRVSDETGVTVSDNAPWLRIGDKGYDDLLARAHGLLYCCLSVPKLGKGAFPLPFCEQSGVKMAWLYTNELATLKELGVVINWVTAAIVSYRTADGLNRYAEWALSEVATSALERRRWLKPTLLATYGVLAARPRLQEFGFRASTGGTPKEYPAGSGVLKVQARISDRDVETPVANVIYRGLIEAEQRVESLRLARTLHTYGCRVLCVYADSVFVEAGSPLPFLPAPWVVKHELDGLLFHCPTAFTSVQLTKLPGIPQDAQKRQALIEQARRINA